MSRPRHATLGQVVAERRSRFSTSSQSEALGVHRTYMRGLVPVSFEQLIPLFPPPRYYAKLRPPPLPLLPATRPHHSPILASTSFCAYVSSLLLVRARRHRRDAYSHVIATARGRGKGIGRAGDLLHSLRPRHRSVSRQCCSLQRSLSCVRTRSSTSRSASEPLSEYLSEFRFSCDDIICSCKDARCPAHIGPLLTQGFRGAAAGDVRSADGHPPKGATGVCFRPASRQVIVFPGACSLRGSVPFPRLLLNKPRAPPALTVRCKSGINSLPHP